MSSWTETQSAGYSLESLVVLSGDPRAASPDEEKKWPVWADSHAKRSQPDTASSSRPSISGGRKGRKKMGCRVIAATRGWR